MAVPTRSFLLLIAALILSQLGIVDADARLRVVATLPDLAALAAAVGGEDVEVTALTLPTQDPHYVDARPSLLLPLSRADLLVLNGNELEVGWLPALLTNARNRHLHPGGRGHLDASTVVELLDVPTGRIDRSMGDVHPGGNPHFTFDPRRARSIANALRDALGALDPANQARYTQRAAALTTELDRLIEEQRQRFAALPAERRQLVTYHRSLLYLLDWLDIEDVAHVEPRPGIDPTPQHTAAVLRTMRQRGIRVVLQEGFYPRNVSETLCSMSEAQLVVIPGGTNFQRGQTYLEHIRGIADALHRALEGTP